MITLIDHMGNDASVANAARVSLSKETFLEAGLLKATDRHLLEYLAKNNHISPFFHVQFSFRIQMPIFTKMQWEKSKIGISPAIDETVINSVSRRYVNDAPEFFMPDYFRPKAESVKQGSADIEHPRNGYWMQMFERYYQTAKDFYESAIRDGICPEQARMMLPQSMMTEFIQTGSLAAFFRIWKLRGYHTHAQKEIQIYAEQVAELIKPIVPNSWEVLSLYGKDI